MGLYDSTVTNASWISTEVPAHRPWASARSRMTNGKVRPYDLLNASMRLRVTAIPNDLPASARRFRGARAVLPTPLSVTEQHRVSLPAIENRIVIVPGVCCGSKPWINAFSTKGCMNNGGTEIVAGSASGGSTISASTRSPNRNCSR